MFRIVQFDGFLLKCRAKTSTMRAGVKEMCDGEKFTVEFPDSQESLILVCSDCGNRIVINQINNP